MYHLYRLAQQRTPKNHRTPHSSQCNKFRQPFFLLCGLLQPRFRLVKLIGGTTSGTMPWEFNSFICEVAPIIQFRGFDFTPFPIRAVENHHRYIYFSNYRFGRRCLSTNNDANCRNSARYKKSLVQWVFPQKSFVSFLLITIIQSKDGKFMLP